MTSNPEKTTFNRTMAEKFIPTFSLVDCSSIADMIAFQREKLRTEKSKLANLKKLAILQVKIERLQVKIGEV